MTTKRLESPTDLVPGDLVSSDELYNYLFASETTLSRPGHPIKNWVAVPVGYVLLVSAVVTLIREASETSSPALLLVGVGGAGWSWAMWWKRA